MSPELVAILCRMHAEVATIEAMKALNTERERNGLALGYDEERFFDCSIELRRLAKMAEAVANRKEPTVVLKVSHSVSGKVCRCNHLAEHHLSFASHDGRGRCNFCACESFEEEPTP